MNPDVILIVVLFAGVLIGALSAWVLAKARFQGQEPPAERYVATSTFQQLQEQADLLREDLRETEASLRQNGAELAAREAEIQHLRQVIDERKAEFERLQQQSIAQFEQVANRLLEEKSQRFSDQNQKQLRGLLDPLRERLLEFEAGIDRKFSEDLKEKVSLKNAVDQLKELNTQLSEDAGRLVQALKGDSKTQGDWGEYRLEMILQKSGLEKDVHYLVQPSFKDQHGSDKRPDFIINLPEGKHLIIDSKVSLTAYEQFFHAENEPERIRHLKAHVDSLRQHVRGLSDKRYEQLYQIQSPDYLLLFVPIEPALSLALQHDANLFLAALEKNIVLVTSSTLLATMRTVSFIWKQERQKRSVQEIARQSGMMYDKFVAFVEDLRQVSNRLRQAQESCDSALNKLSDGAQKGATLVGRAERIRVLGARNSKRLPKELTEEE